MAKKHHSFLKALAEAVFYGEGDTDHPECPECGEEMNFHGGDRAYGDGYWECSDCGYAFSESELNEED